MKMKIEKEILVEALDIVSKAVDKKENSILNNILLIVNESGQLLTMAQDGELIIQHREQTSSFNFEPGQILISPLGHETIKKLPKGELDIELTDNSLTIKSGKNIEKKVLAKNADEYPNTSLESDILTSFSLAGEELRKFSKVSYAASQDDIRPALTGVNCILTDNSLKVTALDGLRIAQTQLAIQQISKNEKSNILISAKKLQTILNIMANVANVMCNITKGYIYFITPQSVVAQRLMDIEYIDFDSIINNMRFDKKIKIKRHQFLEALERSIDFSDSKNNLGHFLITNNQLVIKAEGTMGKSQELLECISDNVDEFAIAFNTKFVIEALKSFSEECVDVEFSSNTSPCKISDANGMAIVLPVRCN